MKKNIPCLAILLIFVCSITVTLQAQNGARLDYGDGFDFSDPLRVGLDPLQLVQNVPRGQGGEIEAMTYSPDGTQLHFLARMNGLIQGSVLENVTARKTFSQSEAFYVSVPGGSPIQTIFTSSFDEPHSWTFNSNGTKVFIGITDGTNGDELRQYALFVPWTPTSGMILERTIPTDALHLKFTPSGEKLFLTKFNGEILQINLNTPFDLINGFNVEIATTLGIGVRNFGFSRDGTKLLFSNTSRVYVYSLNSPYNLNGGGTITSSYDFFPNQGLTFIEQMELNPSGTRLNIVAARPSLQPDVIMSLINNSEEFVETAANTGIVEGKMTITATNTQLKPNSTLTYGVDYVIGNLPAGLIPNLVTDQLGFKATLTFSGQAINHDTDDGQEIIFTMLASGFFNPGSAGVVANRVNASTNTPLIFKRNSSIIYGNGYSLSNGMLASGNDLVPTHTNGLLEPKFSTNGLHLYLVDTITDEISYYQLTTPYDMSTATLITTTALGNSNTKFVTVSPNGESLYVAGDNGSGGRINQYSLSTPFDIRTASGFGSVSPIDFNNNSFAFVNWFSFNYDGTRLYLNGEGSSNNGNVLEYRLLRPFDIRRVELLAAENFEPADEFESFPQHSRVINPTGDKYFSSGRSIDFNDGNSVKGSIKEFVFPNPFTLNIPNFKIAEIVSNEFPLTIRGMDANYNGTEFFLLDFDENPNILKGFEVIDPTPFQEIATNNGGVAGQQRVQLAGAARFLNPGGVLTYGTDYTITNLPSGLIPILTVSANGSFAQLTLTGTAIDNDEADSVESLIFNFATSAYANGMRNIDVVNGTSFSSGISISFTNNPPVAQCANIIVQLDSNGIATITPADVDGGSIASTGIDSITISQAEFTCANLGNNNVILTITDIFGIIDTCTAIVNVQDTITPIISCTNINVQLDENGQYIVDPMAILDPASDDNCSLATFSASPSVLDCSNLGSNTITLTVGDSSGNTTSCTAIITVETNTVQPAAICKNITVALDEMGNASITPADVDNGSTFNACDNVTFTVTPTTFDCSNLGDNTVTLSIVDGANNMTSCTATVTIEDVTPPLVSCNDFTVQLDAAGMASITAADINAGSSDLCSSVSLSLDIETFDCSNLGENIVTLTATDTSGNSEVCTATVTVQDLQDPEAFCQNISLQLSSNGTVSLQASDLNNNSTDNCNLTYELAPFDTISQPIGMDNDAGFFVGWGQAFTANETGYLNKIRLKAYTSLDHDGFVNRTIHLYNGGTGSGIINSIGTPEFSQTGVNFQNASINDAWTNILLDTPFPVIAGQQYSFVIEGKLNVGLNFTNAYPEGQIIAEYVNRTFNADLLFELEFINEFMYDCNDVGGVYTFGMIAVDAAGNTDSCTATVTVLEDTPPIAVCQNITIPMDASGSVTITASDIDGGSTDNCGIANLSIDKDTFTCADIGTNIVTLTVTDTSGNTASCSFDVIVNDTTCFASDYFVTTWETTTANETITIPTNGSGYNYDIDWDGDNIFDDLGVTGNATHTYPTAGIHTVKIRGDFPSIYFAFTGDRAKILAVEQWGTIAWASFSNAFSGCTNLVVNATDAPDLSNVTDMSFAFNLTNAFNQSINHWDVSTITNMRGLFSIASAFNQPLDQWDVSNVTDMGFMFGSATSFNQPLNDWEVTSVTDMVAMFRNATSFNQPLDNWDVSTVTSMGLMFQLATNFNQPLNSWNTSNVTRMDRMFLEATAFNQPLDNWDTSKVVVFQSMFEGATAFDSNIGTWDISAVTNASNMFLNAGLSTGNYDSLLLGWNTLDAGEAQIPIGINFNAGNSTYCLGEDAQNNLINNFSWTITDAGRFCTDEHFITTWQTTTVNETITIPTISGGYNYDIDWDGDNIFDDLGVIGNATHTYTTAGIHTVKIRGDFPRIYFNNTGDKNKILSVEQWGAIEWNSMASAFFGCTNLVVNATDIPDLSNITDMSRMFALCTNFNTDINNWDVSNVTTLFGTLFFTENFNQPLDTWDVSNVTNLRELFRGATNFNQPIGNWDVSNVTTMQWLFRDAPAFNQDIGNWDISALTNALDMFLNAGLSTSNYDNTLIGWNTLAVGETQIPTGIDFNAGTSTYCLGETARANLINNYGWDIEDAGLNCGSCLGVARYTISGWIGTPSLDNFVIIETDYNTDSLGSFEACELIVTEGATLTVAPEDYVLVNGDITVEALGAFLVTHTGSVVQIDDDAVVTGAGSFSVLVDTPELDVRDFMIMGSPMDAETRENVWASAWNVQNYTPANFNPVVAVTDAYNFADAELDDWNLYTTGPLAAGEGFLVRPQTSLNGAGGVFAYDYNTGFLTNGVVTRPLNYNTTQLDSPNMLSNPYPSAIDADVFLDPIINPDIDAVYFWEHILAPDPSFPGSSTTGPNYSMGDVSFYNAMGGIGSASGSATPSNVISTAQGFGIFSNNPAGGTATFNNSMRLTTGNTTLRAPELNRNRLWLHITSDIYTIGGTTLVGFTENATAGFDRRYDSQRVATHVSLFSHIDTDDTGYAIQGREVFNTEMTIALGFSSIIEEETTYTISLKDFDGMAWEANTPFLEDTLTGIVTNLNEASYRFTSGSGVFNNRFILKFKDREVLDIVENTLSQITILPNPTTGLVIVNSPLAMITTISVIDVQGRVVLRSNNVADFNRQIDLSNVSSAVYFINVTTENGTVIKRIIKK